MQEAVMGVVGLVLLGFVFGAVMDHPKISLGLVAGAVLFFMLQPSGLQADAGLTALGVFYIAAGLMVVYLVVQVLKWCSKEGW